MKTKTNTVFAQQVIQAATLGCTKLESGEIRDACGVCGTAYWNTLSKQQRPQAGLVISQAIEDGLLPLIKQGTTQQNHQLFQKFLT
jgi:hypothetical protein